MAAEMQFSVDFLLISRCLGGVLWGGLVAAFLQFTRMGKFIASERTWIAVIIGVGGDLVLGIGADWWVIWMVVAFSSLGVIVRSLVNEHDSEPALNRYKTKWAMEKAIDCCGNVIGALDKALAADGEAKRVRWISTALGAAHQASREVTFARYGEPEKSK